MHLAVKFEPARGCADATLETETAHAGSCTDIAFANVRSRNLQGFLRIGFRDGHGLNVVERTVIAFQNDWIDGRRGAPDIGIACNRLSDQRIGAGSDAKCIGEQDRRFQRAQFLNLHETSAFAKTIDDIASGQHLAAIYVAVMWDDCCHAGIDIAVAQGAVPHAHARHIGDGVVFARLHDAADDAVVACLACHGYFRVLASIMRMSKARIDGPCSKILSFCRKQVLFATLQAKPVR